MKFETARFGTIETAESRVITMKGGILGFDHLRRFTLLIQEQGNPLWWLQSLEDGAVAFVVIDPRVVKPDYRPEISKTDRAFLEISQEEEFSLLSIVTIRHQPFGVTVNLRAPLVINTEKRLASQVVLEEDYPVRYAVALADERDGSGVTAAAQL